jgi:hypothetical protein
VGGGLREPTIAEAPDVPGLYAGISQEPREVLNGQAGLPDEAPQRPLGRLPAVWHGRASVRRVFVAEDEMAASLVIER